MFGRMAPNNTNEDLASTALGSHVVGLLSFFSFSLHNNVGPFSSAPVLFFHLPLVQFDLLQQFEFCSSSTLYIPTYLSIIIIHYVV